MHAAFSVICFTVLSGAGFGLVVLAIAFDLFAAQDAFGRTSTLIATALGVVLATIGLIASTGHLANPRNAWRSFSRFRSSWLSREAVFSVLFYPAVGGYFLGVWLSDGASWSWIVAVLGVLAAVLALITVFCTGMIYASLRTIPQWNHSLVPTNYLLLSLASGGVLLTAIDSFAGEAQAVALLTLVLLVAAAIGKLVYYFWIGKPQGPSINTAVGLTRGQVRLLESGQSSRSFLEKEFANQASASRVRQFRLIVYVLGFAVPIALVALLLESGFKGLGIVAALAMIAGLLAERWLFFAEARHVVNLFYGQQRV